MNQTLNSANTRIAVLTRLVIRGLDCGDTIVVVVDDFSTNHADSKLFDNIKVETISEIKILKLKRNVGHQSAIAIGMAYISKELPDRTVVVMDSNHEDKPEYITLLVDTCLKRNMVVFANRTERSEGVAFRVMYSAFKLLFKLLTGRQYHSEISAPSHRVPSISWPLLPIYGYTMRVRREVFTVH